MAVIRWLGGTSGVVSLAANWVGGAIPDVGGADSVVWDAVTAYGMESGVMSPLVDFTITKAAGVSGAGGVNNGNLGTTSTQPSFGAITGTMTLASRAQFWKVFTTGTIAKIVCGGSSGQTLSVVSGTVTTLGASGVNLVVEAATVLTGYELQDVEGQIRTNSTAITTGNAYGRTKLKVDSRNHTTLNASGEGCVVTTIGTTTGTGASTAAVATGNILAGATYNKQSAATDTLIALRGRNSTLTPAGNPNAAISTATITTVNTTDGSRLIQSVGGYNVVITNIVTLTMSNTIIQETPLG